MVDALATRGDEGRGSCDKPRGAGKQALIRGCPNGETRQGHDPVIEHLNQYRTVERTQGTETSQYPGGKEINRDSRK